MYSLSMPSIFTVLVSPMDIMSFLLLHVWKYFRLAFLFKEKKKKNTVSISRFSYSAETSFSECRYMVNFKVTLHNLYHSLQKKKVPALMVHVNTFWLLLNNTYSLSVLCNEGKLLSCNTIYGIRVTTSNLSIITTRIIQLAIQMWKWSTYCVCLSCSVWNCYEVIKTVLNW